MSKKRHSTKPDPKTSPASQRKREALKHEARKRKAQQRFNLAWLWIGLGLIIVVVTAFLLLKPKDTLPGEIPATQAYQMYQQGSCFLDVRDPQEWNQSHIPNSTNIPLDTLQSRLDELPRDQDIVVVCIHGQRSKTGMAILKQAGFDRVTCLSGGIQTWTSAGYPLEEGSE